MLDPDKLTDALVALTVKAIAAAQAPLLARIDALEKMVAATPVPQDGAPGKDADPEAVASLVIGRIKAQLDAMQEAVEDIQPAPELPDIPAMIALSIADAVSQLPKPQDGAPGKDGAPGPRGEKGERGDNGTGLAGAMIDRDGGLVIMLTNGEAKALGTVVGKDGAPGRDGKDGLGFDDLTFEHDEDGRPVAKFRRGDLVKSFALPGIIDRGTYVAGETYRKGDAVSWGGSLWIAQNDAPDGKPGEGGGFRLAVKKGRDGRDTEAKKVL